MLTEAQTRKKAELLVNKTVAFLMLSHPKVRAAIDKTSRAEWAASLDSLSDEVAEILGDIYGVAGT
jgi:hypothetical protein